MIAPGALAPALRDALGELDVETPAVTLLTVVALAACYQPARRAVLIDPVAALRTN